MILPRFNNHRDQYPKSTSQSFFCEINTTVSISFLWFML